MKITLITTRYEKKEGTKTVWIEAEKDTKEITNEFLDNIIDSIKFFRNLGGSETLIRSYTCRGYQPVRLTSTSPDKQTRTIREFIYQ